ncbi:MAG: DUF1194 domain-containing protein [Stellaceae bacterium]
MRRLGLAAALAAVALLGGARCAAAQADLALVLAVDVSGSVSDERYTLQREGIAGALDSDALAAALAGGVHQTVEIAVVEWAEEQQVVLPWTLVHRREDLAEIAQRLRRAQRSWVHTKTDPGGGIAAADALFAAAPLPPDRKVIDVSGDGRQNTGEIATAEMRDTAVAHGVTINGLPITSGGEPQVDDWYRSNVVGGDGAFLVVADGFEAFATAFQQKIAREVAGRALPRQLALAP